jgi:NTE family protein
MIPTKQTIFNLVIALLLLFPVQVIRAQKVGVVLSGGAASGIAHIGVLKALEENHIPIDYITGTSMGALVGSLYAMGYSPIQIEALAKTEEFKNMSEGIIDLKYAYYFKRGDDNASWITLRLFDSAIINTIPTNVISPISMDFGMMELAAAPSAAADYKFDSLFIPFRCVASDIEKKESVVFKDGDLAQAVRASMSYPFYIRPILVNGKLLFDGGLYNNFPSNIMYNDFYPDVMIGSNVSSNNPPPDEDNILSQIKSMLQSKSSFDLPCDNGIIIQPKTDVGLFNFNNIQPLIDSGYVATIRQMESIKNSIERRIDTKELISKRNSFASQQPKVIFDSIIIEGLNDTEANYARKILRNKNRKVSMENIKEGYFRLSADSKIKYIYPIAKFNSKTGFYDLYLRIKKEKHLIIDFGGVFSTRPVSEGYLGIKYNYLGKFATSIMANGYIGKLYNAAQLKARFDFPFKTPIYVEPTIAWNKFDYYKSSNQFLQDVKPEYLLQNEEFGNLNIGFPTGKKGRIVGGAGGGQITDKYYQTTIFTPKDTADRNDFDFYTAQAYYEINTLNRKQYANQGEYLNFKIRYVSGVERNEPGSTSTDPIEDYHNHHEYYVVKLQGEKYFNRRGTFKIGLFGEGLYSTQTLFRNYISSVLSAPAFQPTMDSKTLFLENYRANEYFAGGLKFVVNIRKNIEVRAEGYIYQPYQAYIRTSTNQTDYTLPFALQHYIASAAVVWNTPIGPMSLGVNYYDQIVNPFSIDFHFGYIIFNKRALE